MTYKEVQALHKELDEKFKAGKLTVFEFIRMKCQLRRATLPCYNFHNRLGNGIDTCSECGYKKDKDK